MANTAHTEDYGNHTISIQYDTDPQNPRTENDNAATMVCFHGRYTLGEDHNYADPHSFLAELLGEDPAHPDPDNMSIQELETALETRPLIFKKLYLYDHSGITMSTSPFSCDWDSGQVGIIYITHDKLKEEGHDLDDPELAEKVGKLLEAEVKEYDYYLRGECYGYVISNSDLEEFDSCWGFLGDMDYCITSAKEVIDAL